MSRRAPAVPESVLVLGGTGRIGGVVARELPGVTAVTGRTSRPGIVPLDFGHSDTAALVHAVTALARDCKASAVMLLAAQSDPDACARDPAGTWEVNAFRACAALDRLADMGIFTIFASSEMVFGPVSGPHRERDCPRPVLTYGKQKHFVEQHISSRGLPCAVVRIAKTYATREARFGIFWDWWRHLEAAPESAPQVAVDQFFSPLHVRDLVRGCAVLIGNRLSGVYHFSSGTRFSRAQLFDVFSDGVFSVLGRRPRAELIRVSDLPVLEARPPDLSLANKETEGTLGFAFTDPATGVAEILAEIHLD